jgi:C4-dicarboxylate transporter DctM subunit
MTLFWVLGSLFLVIAFGLPIAFALAAISILVLAINDVNLLIAVQRLYGGVNSFPLLAVPLFILAGQIMNHSGISARLVDFARAIVGQMKGGLAAINIVTSMFFAGMSGTAMSDTAAVGSIMIPPMVKRGYGRPFTAAVTASSSTIGIIIPPSVPMVLLGAFLGMSTGALFAAGLVAGVLLGIGLILAAWIISKKRNYPIEQSFKVSTALMALWQATPALLMPLIILGGILGGVFTPTEASGVAVVYGVLIGSLYYRTLDLKKLYLIFAESAVLTGSVMLVVSTAHVLGFTFTYEQLAEAVLTPISTMEVSPTTFLFLLSLVLIFAGTFLDGIAMMYIIVPLFYPGIQYLGIDPVHYGMVVIICWGIGQQTPPVGAALFITSAISEVDVMTLTRANIPFIFVMGVILILVILFPNTLVLSLPRALGF